MLTVSGLCKTFGGPQVLQDLVFQVGEGEIFALLGPSGCGKTTALRIIAGLESADRGRVALGDQVLVDAGVDIPPECRRVGLVFQEYALFPHLTVEENVAFGLGSLPREERRQRCDEALSLMGVTALRGRLIHGLSGGEQQRVALARSLAPRPQLLLLDESFGSLDASLRGALREEVRACLKEAGMTTLLVTHDQSEALSFADRIGVMDGGSLLQVGTPEQVYHNPESAFVAQFLGQTNLLQGVAAGSSVETDLGPVPLAVPTQGRVRISVRPEDVELAPGGAGEIVARDFTGADCTYRVRLGEALYLAHTDHREIYAIGERVALSVTHPATILREEP
ncbi:MAG: ABC transporter ATP-binding protein [Planctomycetota bacterium]|jgi:iron(III) transport system ATP-binding protein